MSDLDLRFLAALDICSLGVGIPTERRPWLDHLQVGDDCVHSSDAHIAIRMKVKTPFAGEEKRQFWSPNTIYAWRGNSAFSELKFFRPEWEEAARFSWIFFPEEELFSATPNTVEPTQILAALDYFGGRSDAWVHAVPAYPMRFYCAPAVAVPVLHYDCLFPDQEPRTHVQAKYLRIAAKAALAHQEQFDYRDRYQMFISATQIVYASLDGVFCTVISPLRE